MAAKIAPLPPRQSFNKFARQFAPIPANTDQSLVTSIVSQHSCPMSRSHRKYADGRPDSEPAEEHGVCAWPDCIEDGAYKAPRSRNALRDYQWLCLDHVREFNRSWNFYRNMSDNQMEAAIRSDTTWNRPTWPLGGANDSDNNARIDPHGFDSIRDPFGFFSENPGSQRTSNAELSGTIGHALDVLGLQAPISLDDVKARYKVLVKRHHPDTNGGDKNAEDRLKAIIEAYEVLKTELVS